MLSTHSKVRIARLASRCLLAARALCGIGAEARVTRAAVKWRLDLREGIDLALYLGVYENSTRRLLARRVRHGDVVLDIGANIGALTLPLAQLVGIEGQVHAFEPTAFAYAKLRRNLAENPSFSTRVHAEQLLLVERAGAAHDEALYSSWPLSADDEERHPLHRGALKSLQGATATSLDEYLAARGVARVDVIKLDVDGNELRVLEGARGTLARCRPLLVFELAPYILDEQAGTLEAILALLGASGYRLKTLENERPLPADAAALRAWIPHGCGLNILGEAQ